MDARQALIHTIEQYYSIDTEYAIHNMIGGRLLIKAFKETKFDWRTLPQDVLQRWAELCKEYAASIEEKETF